MKQSYHRRKIPFYGGKKGGRFPERGEGEAHRLDLFWGNSRQKFSYPAIKQKRRSSRYDYLIDNRMAFPITAWYMMVSQLAVATRASIKSAENRIGKEVAGEGWAGGRTQINRLRWEREEKGETGKVERLLSFVGLEDHH